MAFSNGGKANVTEGSGIKMRKKNGATVLNFETNATRKVVNFASGLTVYILGMSSVCSKRRKPEANFH